MKRIGLLFVPLFALFAASLSAQVSNPDSRFQALSFLLGDWVGEGTGEPGDGTGGFSFHLDLQEKVVVRKNYANYPASGARAAFSHHDLMVVYRDAAQNKLRAVYFDNEDHMIHYSVEASDGGAAVQFVSDTEPAVARFRLTYRKTSADHVGITFEIAPPGKPDAFAAYINASARRSAKK